MALPDSKKSNNRPSANTPTPDAEAIATQYIHSLGIPTTARSYIPVHERHYRTRNQRHSRRDGCVCAHCGQPPAACKAKTTCYTHREIKDEIKREIEEWGDMARKTSTPSAWKHPPSRGAVPPWAEIPAQEFERFFGLYNLHGETLDEELAQLT